MSVLDRRIGLLFALFLVLISVAFVRALYFGSVRGSALAQAASAQQQHVEEEPARRGTITDRDGQELAVSAETATLVANPFLIKNPAALARRVKPYLPDLPMGTLVEALSKPGTGYSIVARQVPGGDAAAIMKLKLDGLSTEASEKRTYPQGLLAGQVLGIVGRTDSGATIGREGLEYFRNSLLAGSPGKIRTVRDASGKPLRADELQPTQPGARLELTIDSAIQQRAETVLGAVGARYRPKSATAVVMDPKTNEILAMANWPRVDPNHPDQAPAAARQNRAVSATYEPGSTFKAFTVAGALEDGTTTPTRMYDLPSKIKVADREIGEAEARPEISLTTAQILARSSNVGAIKIGLGLGRKRFDHWIRTFGFGKPTGIDLPGEEQGIQPRLDQYSGSSMGNLPIGQGESVTSLQIATAYSAIANGGVLRPPRVVRSIDGRVLPRRQGHRIISKEVAAEIRQMLEGVVEAGGTASSVAIPGYHVAGKTGTANKVDAGSQEYSKRNYVSSFVGFAPAADPKLLVSVMVDQPQGGDIAGGVVAAPAFQDIASYALQYLRVPQG